MLIDLPPASEQQHRYYRAVVVPAYAEFWQLSVEDAHEWLKAQHGRGASTRTLTTVGFSDYLRRIFRAAREDGVEIPRPNEEWS